VSVVDELLAAIEADPKDEASQLVIGDFLQAAGDPRGDLIVLAHAEGRGLLDDAEALEQLLLLAAEYSFPYAWPAEPMLPFVRRGAASHSYELRHGPDHYTLAYRRRGFHFEQLGKLARRIPVELVPEQSDEQVYVVLTILSDVIRAGTPFSDELRFPYGTMPLPQYEGSPLRCYMLPLEFTIPREILRNRYGLAARDYFRWHRIWQRLRAMQRR
jgi:uncharacterized protein (TIGR02996 family)